LYAFRFCFHQLDIEFGCKSAQRLILGVDGEAGFGGFYRFRFAIGFQIEVTQAQVGNDMPGIQLQCLQ
jgi:hypothetical protein